MTASPLTTPIGGRAWTWSSRISKIYRTAADTATRTGWCAEGAIFAPSRDIARGSGLPLEASEAPAERLPAGSLAVSSACLARAVQRRPRVEETRDLERLDRSGAACLSGCLRGGSARRHAGA